MFHLLNCSMRSCLSIVRLLVFAESSYHIDLVGWVLITAASTKFTDIQLWWWQDMLSVWALMLVFSCYTCLSSGYQGVNYVGTARLEAPTTPTREDTFSFTFLSQDWKKTLCCMSQLDRVWLWKKQLFVIVGEKKEKKRILLVTTVAPEQQPKKRAQ